jgi:hypothetical protein
MRSTLIGCAFLLSAVSAAPALANMCLTDSGRRCATGMPVDGYCMCGTEGGTVVRPGHQEQAQRPPPSQRPPPPDRPTPPPQ